MNIDENDLMFTNRFIKLSDDLNPPIGVDYNKEFQKSYKKHLLRPNSIISETASFEEEPDDKRYIRSYPTLITIDSRDRDHVLYPHAHSFRSYLPRNFYNIKSISLNSIEFPNTNAVINSNNNLIYWINKEDIENDIIDTITQYYPVYKATLRIGSYIASKLEDEIESRLNTIKRRNNTGIVHYFIPKLDIETDVVSFTSLILTKLGSSPIDTVSGTSIISVNAIAHGFSNGDIAYIIGCRSVAGIPVNEINEIGHIVTVVNVNVYKFEVITNATETISGGGSNVNSGKLAPLKLLFGSFTKTVAPNIGYPMEDSSEQISTYIQNMVPFVQVQISTNTDHQLSISDINTPVILSGTNTSPNIDGTVVVSQVLSNTSFIVSVSSAIDISVFNSGTVTTLFTTVSISSVENFQSDTFLLTTYTPHNYNQGDQNITLYNTTTSPTFDGDNIIFSVLSSTQLILYGKILNGGSQNSITQGDIGFTPTRNPLTSSWKSIINITIGAMPIVTIPEHDLKVGDKIKFYNISTTPSLLATNNGVFDVFTIIDSDNITINFNLTSVDLSDLSLSGIGTSLVTMYFPSHGFNSIVSVTNNGINLLSVQTLLDHGLVTGDLVRIMQSNTVPNIDDSYIVTVTNTDTFDITSFNITINGSYGIIGMNLNFKIYNLNGFGGFQVTDITGIEFSIRDIIDSNTFTFLISEYYSQFTETGGGSGIFISSLKHGFEGVQDNTKNDIIARSINLQGENYSLLTSPQLKTMLNTGSVDDIFARITLENSPGAMCFQFLSNPKIFNASPLDTINHIDFSIKNYDNSFYEFNDLDYSFTIEITENIDTSTAFNINSKRGVSDQADSHSIRIM